MPLLPLVLLTLAALAARPATAATNSTCFYPTHFVTTSLATCTAACNTLLASKGVGSVYPETYTKGGCCALHTSPQLKTACARTQRALLLLPSPAPAGRRRPLLQVPVPKPRRGGRPLS